MMVMVKVMSDEQAGQTDRLSVGIDLPYTYISVHKIYEMSSPHIL